MAFAQLVCLLSIIQDDLCQFHEPPRVRLRFDKMIALNAVTLAALFTTVTIPLMGMLADRVGRKQLYIAGTLAIMAFAFPYFWLVSLGSPLWFTVATSVALAVCWAPI